MNTIASPDQFKPIRIGENLVVNYNREYSLFVFSRHLAGWVKKAFCKCCDRMIDISNMGECVEIAHEKWKATVELEVHSQWHYPHSVFYHVEMYFAVICGENVIIVPVETDSLNIVKSPWKVLEKSLNKRSSNLYEPWLMRWLRGWWPNGKALSLIIDLVQCVLWRKFVLPQCFSVPKCRIEYIHAGCIRLII